MGCDLGLTIMGGRAGAGLGRDGEDGGEAEVGGVADSSVGLEREGREEVRGCI